MRSWEWTEQHLITCGLGQSPLLSVSSTPECEFSTVCMFFMRRHPQNSWAVISFFNQFCLMWILHYSYSTKSSQTCLWAQLFNFLLFIQLSIFLIISWILMEERKTTACSSNCEITPITACSWNCEMKAKGQLSKDLGVLRAGDQLVNGLLSKSGGGLCTDDPWGVHNEPSIQTLHYINLTPKLRSSRT